MGNFSPSLEEIKRGRGGTILREKVWMSSKKLDAKLFNSIWMQSDLIVNAQLLPEGRAVPSLYLGSSIIL